MSRFMSQNMSWKVTPLAGVWIETLWGRCKRWRKSSLPLRECGLKPLPGHFLACFPLVTPLAGVWIETVLATLSLISSTWSLPLRECGLKQYPLALALFCHRHSPCGSVD